MSSTDYDGLIAIDLEISIAVTNIKEAIALYLETLSQEELNAQPGIAII